MLRSPTPAGAPLDEAALAGGDPAPAEAHAAAATLLQDGLFGAEAPQPPAEAPPLPGADATGATLSRQPAPRLPDARRILAWLYAGRLVVAAAAFVSVAWVWGEVGPNVTLATSSVLVFTIAVTALAFWYTHLADHRPSRSFLYGQTVYDTLFVTWIVYVTGGQQSAFAPLYILVIFAAAILLPFLGGLLVGLLVSVLYFAQVVWHAHGSLDASVALQLALFTTVALVTGYLGDRLRQTGTALGEVETELQLLRLDTDDILSTINTGILTVDGYGRLAYMNPTASELLSLPLSNWLGRPVLDALDRAAPGLGWVIDRTRRERRPIARSEAGDLANGSFVLGVSTTLVERYGGDAPPVTAIFQDITEKKRLELLERRAERLEAIAELSASLAHEIKNPLASIRSAVEQLSDAAISAEDNATLRELVVRESNRLTRLLGEFIDFARVKVTAPEPVDLVALVEEVVALVRAHPDAEAREIRVDAPAPGTLHVRGAEDLLHRAVLNLVLNAAQWAGAGGRVDVSLSRTATDRLSSLVGAAELVRLVVADSGPGVDPDVADHIFNPFFTLRPGETGLGLALVQRAAEAHGGAVFVDARRTRGAPGAVFTLCLPLLEEGATRTPGVGEEASQP